jgi:hypothetical protein
VHKGGGGQARTRLGTRTIGLARTGTGWQCSSVRPPIPYTHPHPYPHPYHTHHKVCIYTQPLFWGDVTAPPGAVYLVELAAVAPGTTEGILHGLHHPHVRDTHQCATGHTPPYGWEGQLSRTAG